MSFKKASSDLLFQPYPYFFGQNKLWKQGLGIFFLGFFFVYLFEPFTIVATEHRLDYFWISVIHVAVSSLIFFAFFSMLNLTGIGEEKWNVGKEILSLSLVFLLMGLANFFLRDLIYDNPNNWSIGYLFEEIRNTFLVGIILILILVPLNFSRVYSKNTNNATLLEPPYAENEVVSGNRVFITTQLKADDFNLHIEEFIFAKAEGNYVEFHLGSEGNHRKELKRLTIKDLEQYLKSYSWILKTHRSYLVNGRKIKAVSGNAQGYQLSLHGCPATVPVSRGMVKEFDKAFRTLAL